jgi:probable rRNA maturation factor
MKQQIGLSIINKTDCQVKKNDFKKVLVRAQKVLKLNNIDELSVAVVSQMEMQKINDIYRGEKKPTDVLSFDYGEILLCPAYSIKKYKLNKKSVQEKMIELFAHGLAHIAGLNHHNRKEEKKMGGVEQKILT